MEAIANGGAALVLVFLDDEFAPLVLLGIAIGCVVAGMVTRGLTDHISQRYFRSKPVPDDLPRGWEWMAPCVQVGIVALIAWQLGAAVGVVVAATVAGAAIPASPQARETWQALTKRIGFGA